MKHIAAFSIVCLAVLAPALALAQNSANADLQQQKPVYAATTRVGAQPQANEALDNGKPTARATKANARKQSATTPTLHADLDKEAPVGKRVHVQQRTAAGAKKK